MRKPISILRRSRLPIEAQAASWEVDPLLLLSWLDFRASQPGCSADGYDFVWGEEVPKLRFDVRRFYCAIAPDGAQAIEFFERHFSPGSYRMNPDKPWINLGTNGVGATSRDREALEIASSWSRTRSLESCTVGFAQIPVGSWRELSYVDPQSMIADAEYDVGQVRQTFFHAVLASGSDFYAAMQRKDYLGVAKASARRPRDVKNIAKRLLEKKIAIEVGLASPKRIHYG